MLPGAQPLQQLLVPPSPDTSLPVILTSPMAAPIANARANVAPGLGLGLVACTVCGEMAPAGTGWPCGHRGCFACGACLSGHVLAKSTNSVEGEPPDRGVEALGGLACFCGARECPAPRPGVRDLAVRVAPEALDAYLAAHWRARERGVREQLLFEPLRVDCVAHCEKRRADRRGALSTTCVVVCLGAPPCILTFFIGVVSRRRCHLLGPLEFEFCFDLAESINLSQLFGRRPARTLHQIREEHQAAIASLERRHRDSAAAALAASTAAGSASPGAAAATAAAAAAAAVAARRTELATAHVRYALDSILCTTCPSGHVFDNFTGCFLVTCHCGSTFCGFCLGATGSHAHVARCPENPRKGDVYGSRGLFLTHQASKAQARVRSFLLRDLAIAHGCDDSTRREVALHLLPHLRDRGSGKPDIDVGPEVRRLIDGQQQQEGGALLANGRGRGQGQGQAALDAPADAERPRLRGGGPGANVEAAGGGCGGVARDPPHGDPDFIPEPNRIPQRPYAGLPLAASQVASVAAYSAGATLSTLAVVAIAVAIPPSTSEDGLLARYLGTRVAVGSAAVAGGEAAAFLANTAMSEEGRAAVSQATGAGMDAAGRAAAAAAEGVRAAAVATAEGAGKAAVAVGGAVEGGAKTIVEGLGKGLGAAMEGLKFGMGAASPTNWWSR